MTDDDQKKIDLATKNAARRRAKIARLESVNADLLEALKAVRDDLLRRAEFDDGEVVVACGASVWIRVNHAISLAEKSQ